MFFRAFKFGTNCAHHYRSMAELFRQSLFPPQDNLMKRILAIAVVAATLSFVTSPSTASASDHHGGHHHARQHSYHHGHHQGYHSSHYRGGHGYGSGYRHGVISPYAPSYRYRAGYGARPYGYGSGHHGRYPSRGYGSGLHLDINGVHILGRRHF